MAICIYCEGTFDPPKPGTKFCRNCYYTGRPHAAHRKRLLDRLLDVGGVREADIQHTGGGCFGLAITLQDGRYLFATNAVEDGGSWAAEASLPDPGEPWGMGVYADADEGFYECDGPVEMLIPLTDRQLVSAVKRLVEKGGV